MQVDSSVNHYSISIEEVMDYNYCSMYYKLKHCIGRTENIAEAYDRLLRSCFSSYLNLLKSHSSVNIGYLTKLWGKYWIKDKSMAKFVAAPSANTRDTYDKLRKNGIDTVVSFHNLLKDDSQYPILINKGYQVPITKTITLTGKWEYIRELHREDGTSIFQILKFTHRKDKFQTLMQMRHDIELTAAAYAFQHVFTTPAFEVIYANIYKERLVQSYRNDKDISILMETVINTVKCISNEIYSICPDARCYHCTYRNLCENYIKIKEG